MNRYKLGENIRALRKSRVMTLEDVGKKAKTTKSAIHRIENGGNTTVDTLIEVSKALSVPVSYLLSDDFAIRVDTTAGGIDEWDIKVRR